MYFIILNTLNWRDIVYFLQGATTTHECDSPYNYYNVVTAIKCNI